VPFGGGFWGWVWLAAGELEVCVVASRAGISETTMGSSGGGDAEGRAEGRAEGGAASGAVAATAEAEAGVASRDATAIGARSCDASAMLPICSRAAGALVWSS